MDTKTLLTTNIIDLLGLKDLAESEKQQLMNRMLNVVNGRVADRVVGSLTMDQRAEFDAIIDSGGSPEDVDAFMRRAVPDYEKIAAEEALRFKQEMLEDVEAVKQVISGKQSSPQTT